MQFQTLKQFQRHRGIRFNNLNCIIMSCKLHNFASDRATERISLLSNFLTESESRI